MLESCLQAAYSPRGQSGHVTSDPSHVFFREYQHILQPNGTINVPRAQKEHFFLTQSNCGSEFYVGPGVPVRTEH